MNKKVIYHYVFKTYKGRFVLVDKDSVSFLYITFEEICAQKEFELLKCKILADHVHLLVKFEIKHQIAYVIRMVKGISSREFFKKFKTNRYEYRKLWGRSYFSEQISEEKLSTLINYIENQEKNNIDKKYRSKEPRVLLSGSVTKK
ncbi:MAG: IS200/IS605 family transposase [bacterium]